MDTLSSNCCEWLMGQPLHGWKSWFLVIPGVTRMMLVGKWQGSGASDSRDLQLLDVWLIVIGGVIDWQIQQIAGHVCVLLSVIWYGIKLALLLTSHLNFYQNFRNPDNFVKRFTVHPNITHSFLSFIHCLSLNCFSIWGIPSHIHHTKR